MKPYATLCCGIALILGACSQSSEPTLTTLSGWPVRCTPGALSPPCGPGAVIGTFYPYELYTHCGIIWAYFDGRWWQADPVLSEGHSNPPRGWGNPQDSGHMALLKNDHARFRSANGFLADFKPLPREQQSYPGQPLRVIAQSADRKRG
jgi:hypothetical protein